MENFPPLMSRSPFQAAIISFALLSHPVLPIPFAPQTRGSLLVGPVDVGGVDEGRDAVHLLADRRGALAEGGRPRQLHQLRTGAGIGRDL